MVKYFVVCSNEETENFDNVDYLKVFQGKPKDGLYPYKRILRPNIWQS